MKNLLIISVFVLTASFLESCSTSEGKTGTLANSERIPVRIMKLQKQSITSPVQASGQFTTDDETNLSFKTGGVIEKIFAKEGDAIRAGQLLATLNLTEINAQVAQARLAFEKATRDYERVSNLYRDSVATLEQFQNAKTGLDVATQQYEAARFNRAYSEIHALGNGFVLKKLANEGQVIQSGTAVFQTNGAHKGNWILKTAVSDKVWASISIHDKATVSTDAAPGEIFPAYVSRKSEGTDPYTGSFTIELTLAGKLPVSIASGMFGKAVITPSASSQAWSIPYDALLDGDAQSGYVFVTDDFKTARKAQVTIAGIDQNTVLISAGLEHAQALIVSGSAYLRDQSPITLLEK